MTERKRLPASARDALMGLYAMDVLLDQYKQDYMRIADRADYGRRDMGLIRSRLDALIKKILQTVPGEQLRSIRHQMEQSTIRVAVKSPKGRIGDDLWVCSREELVELVRFAVWGACPSCDKEDGSRCKLRQVIDALPVDVDKIVMGCETIL